MVEQERIEAAKKKLENSQKQVHEILAEILKLKASLAASCVVERLAMGFERAQGERALIRQTLLEAGGIVRKEKTEDTLLGFGTMQSDLEEAKALFEEKFKTFMEKFLEGLCCTNYDMLLALHSIGEELCDVFFESLKSSDKNLCEQLSKNVFVYKDIPKMDNYDVQNLICVVNRQDLIAALKYSDEAVKEKFFKNMSRGRGKMLKEDIEYSNKTLKDAKKSKAQIIQTAFKKFSVFKKETAR